MLQKARGARWFFLPRECHLWILFRGFLTLESSPMCLNGAASCRTSQWWLVLPVFVARCWLAGRREITPIRCELIQRYPEFLDLGRRRNETHMGGKAPLSADCTMHTWLGSDRTKGRRKSLQNVGAAVRVLVNIEKKWCTSNWCKKKDVRCSLEKS